jgi:hypothetical protein
MARMHQPGQSVFRSILPENIEWQSRLLVRAGGRGAVQGRAVSIG